MSSPPPLRSIALVALTAVGLPGCASPRERASHTAWEALHSSLEPRSTTASIPSSADLTTYVELALARNPRIHAQSSRWRAGLERIPQARSLPDPTLTYGNFLEEVETRVGPQRHRVGVTQTVPWPGKLLGRADVALEQAEVARALTEAVRREVAHEVASAFAAYFELAREMEIAEQTLSLVRSWEAVAQARLRAGAKSGHQNVVKAQLEIGRLEDLLTSLRHRRRPLSEALRSLLDLPAQTELPLPAALLQRTPPGDEAELLALLDRHGPTLAVHDRRVAAAERAVDLAYQGYFPDLSLGLDWIEVGPARASGVRGSGDDAWMARVGLSLPIWVGKTGASVAEARAHLLAARDDRQAVARALASSVSHAFYDYRDAERKVRLYTGSLIPKAEESLLATARAFEGGEGTFLDLLDAERSLLDLRLARERARSRRLTAVSRLEMLTGVDFPGPEEETR